MNRKAEEQPTFVIDTPPPFTSGSLHIGRAYACILSDVTARYKRMRGYNVLLPQGWDTQGLPTELAVQSKFGISPSDVDKFRSACRAWTSQMIKQMRRAMLRLGYVPDWSLEYKTMDKCYQRKVQLALFNLHKRGRIYRSKHPTHWCPKCKTALANAELGYIKEETTLAYINFQVQDETVEIATSRPELLHACVALAFNPEDKRYQRFIDKEAQTPIYSKKVPIIADASADMEYGTGLVMICTFGNEQDVETVLRHRLPVIEALDEEGKIVNSKRYDGLSVKDAREAILKDLTEAGVLLKTVKMHHNVLTHTERSTCQAPIEFLSKPQWFIRITDLKEELLQVARQIEWFPKDIEKRLIDWIDGLEWDWLFSRQRTFGTPIPFWYCQKCDYIMAPKKKDLPLDPTRQKPPVSRCPRCGSKALVGAKDVCDCWIDSSITPLVIAGWPKALQNYPLNLRQQGSEIIRTWAFYSILQCYQQTGQLPFKAMLVNGMVLGSDRHAMSSSLGNAIDPLVIIEKYGADALRQGLLSASIGSDFPFEMKDVAFSYGFMQKFWNACRFAQQHLADYKLSNEKPRLCIVDIGILSVLQRLTDTLTENIEKFQFNKALQELQNFVWHELCDYYIEIAKSRLYKPKKKWMKTSVQYTLYVIVWILTRLYAPFAPHMTEEISQVIFNKTPFEAGWPNVERNLIDEDAEKAWRMLKGAISTIWKLKSRLRLSLNAEISNALIRCGNISQKEIFDKLKMDIKEAGKIRRVQIVIDDLCSDSEVALSRNPLRA